MLQSFKLVDWVGVPLSPTYMAENGFRCVGDYKVECTVCGAKLDFTYLQFNLDPSAV